MRTDGQAQSVQVHDDLDPSDNSTQTEAPCAANEVASAASPATLLDRFMQEGL
jgi:hypothetical protein